jgi:vancomycin permeability regulator SanA
MAAKSRDRRRSRIRLFLVLASPLALWVLAVLALRWSSAAFTYSTTETIPARPVAIVFGAGLKSVADPPQPFGRRDRPLQEGKGSEAPSERRQPAGRL